MLRAGEGLERDDRASVAAESEQVPGATEETGSSLRSLSTLPHPQAAPRKRPRPREVGSSQ